MNTQNQIEFNQVKEIWRQLAVTDEAKKQIDGCEIALSEIEVRKRLRDTTDAVEMMERFGTPPLQNLTQIKEVMEIVKKGDCLTPFQLEKVEIALAAVKRLKDYLDRGKICENPLAYYEANFYPLEELREEILRQIRGGRVDDHASKNLLQVREQIAKCEDEMKKSADQIIRKYKECMADSFHTIRNGRVCVPVKKEYRLKVGGSVIDKSTTGSTLFIEPAGVAKYYEQLQLLKIEEENEVYRILYTLSAMLAAQEMEMNENIFYLEKMDFIFSKGKLSMDLGAVEPQINTERVILLKDARHPLMNRDEDVPLQFEIGKETSGIVITGPNTGGKTVSMKKVMLNCYMAQCGLHVTCKEANVCLNSSYLCDIGDGQNLSENLSTFSAHITNVLEILKVVTRDSLVIMDELGSGTDPAEGMGIAIAILEKLRESGALFLVTTHYPEVKEYAKAAQGIVNACMTFDKESLQPTYQLVIGEAGESCAFYIADRLGMPNEMLRIALTAAYGENAAKDYHFSKPDEVLPLKHGPKLRKQKREVNQNALADKFHIGDSVMVYPDKKLGIVCEPVNEKGVLRVQMPNKKIYINHKRVKLQVAAKELYPEDYDFSIIFDTVENRKIRHDMSRKYTTEMINIEE